MKICDLLNALINISEKGANIARIIRSEESLLKLLVQEKKGNHKNERFLHDFKTLADVLVQELVIYDLSQQVLTYSLFLFSYPNLLNFMYSKATLKKDRKNDFKTDYCLMQVKSIAECSFSAILWTFLKLPVVIKTFVLPTFEWPIYTGFTVQI